MARPKRDKSKKRQLIASGGAIVLALAMAIPRLFPDDGTAAGFDEEAPDDSTLFGGADAFPMDPDLPEPGTVEPGAGGPSRLVADLLAQYGSAPAVPPIPNAFWQPPIEPPAPAPEPETPEASEPEPEATALETGDPVPESPAAPPKPPPPHRVTLIYLTQNVRRAVVDGVVVGVGDPLGIGHVKAIHRHGIIVQGATGRVLVLYALGSADPLVPDAAGGGSPWPAAVIEDAPSDD